MGTQPQLLRQLGERAGVQKVELEVNYRSGQDIIDASLEVLGEARTIRGINEGGDIVIHAPTDGDEGQREFGLQLVRDALTQGVPPEEITVLSYSGRERDLVAAKLRDAGIPTYARSEDDYRTTAATMAVEALASYAGQESPDLLQLADLLDTWAALPGAEGDHKQTVAVVDLLTNTNSDEAASDFLEALVPLGLDHLTTARADASDGVEIQRMRAALRTGGTLSGMTVEALGRRARAQGCVMAATIHGVKGLEFDVVILLDAEEGRLPHWGTINSGNPGDMDEDRRKFYVSLTRAKKRVHIVWAGWRISRAGNRYSVDPSRFLRSLMA